MSAKPPRRRDKRGRFIKRPEPIAPEVREAIEKVTAARRQRPLVVENWAEGRLRFAYWKSTRIGPKPRPWKVTRRKENP